MYAYKHLSESSIFVCFDGVGLYPYVPHEEGIETVAEYLDARQDKTVSTKSLIDLVLWFRLIVALY